MRDIERVAKKMSLPFTIDFTSFVGHVANQSFKKKDINLTPLVELG